MVSLAHAVDPVQFAREALDLHPDPKQSEVLQRDPRRIILNCSRQWGKSTVTAIRALHHALTHPNSLTLILAPAERQSIELLNKIQNHLRTLQISTRRDPSTRAGIRLPNHARILALPNSEATIRGFSASLLIIDEAARVPDDLYHSVRPMLATNDEATLCLLSTPHGRNGFFYDTWTAPDSDFLRISAPATECPRISAKFLDEEKRNLPEAVFAQEYLCQFAQTHSALFRHEDIHAALDPNLQPLVAQHQSPFAPAPRLRFVMPDPWQHIYIGIDLGQKRDYSALAIVDYIATLSNSRDAATFQRLPDFRYCIRHLERFPLDTPYPHTIDLLCQLVRDSTLGDRASLIVDSTGVGAPVYDMLTGALNTFRDRPRTYSVTITAGDQAHADRKGNWFVPKRDLMLGLYLAFRDRKILIASRIPHAKTLTRELELMQRQITPTGHERYEPAQSSAHDDLLLATALAIWRARQHRLPAILDPAFRMPSLEALL
jgi:hypothetical protein